MGYNNLVLTFDESNEYSELIKIGEVSRDDNHVKTCILSYETKHHQTDKKNKDVYHSVLLEKKDACAIISFLKQQFKIN